MKLKSLILGSVAAAGLSTAGYAADLGVLTSLDVCDSLGISGLTLSSSDNCLQITGGVSYEFAIGQFRTEQPAASTFDGARNIPVAANGEDWDSRVISWVKFVGTAASDFGPASATIKLKNDTRLRTEGTANGWTQTSAETQDGAYVVDEAYVSIGDSTVVMAGKKGSIANLGDDTPFNSYLGLFNSDAIDGKGVAVDADYAKLGGNVIQIVSEVADGVKVGVGLEDLDAGNHTGVTVANASAGTLVGVVEYAGEGVTAHLTAAAFDVFSNNVNSWFVHAGATGSFDAFKVRGAVGYWNGFKATSVNVLNALVSAEGKFDLFTLSASAEIANVTNTGGADYTDYGFGAQVDFAVTEGVKLNLGARYFYDDSADLNTTQVAAKLVAALTETLSASAEIGGYFGSAIANGNFRNDTVVYGGLGLAWNPGGGFTSSLDGTVNSENAYKVTFKAAKNFQ